MLLSCAVEMYKQERVIEGLTDSTIASYQYALDRYQKFLGDDRYLDEILQEPLPEFFTYLRGEELSVHTIYGIRTSVRAFFGTYTRKALQTSSFVCHA